MDYRGRLGTGLLSHLQQSYTKVLLLFKVYLSSTMYDMAFIQDYSVVPCSMVCEDDHDTGFQCLMLDDSPSGTRFVSPKEFIHADFVVNTDDNCINCYFMVRAPRCHPPRCRIPAVH